MNHNHHHDQAQHHPAHLEQAKDPVCGMTVSPGTAKWKHQEGGKTYFFCNPRCLEKFRAAPEKYIAQAAQVAAPEQPGAQAHPVGGQGSYTCPMHPEIVRAEPGACPICGMALEPRTVALEDAPSPELVDMARRFWVSVPLSLLVLGLGMAEMIPGQPLQHLFGRSRAWIELALSTPVVLWGGAPFFERGWASIKSRRLNMFTLISIGTGAAYAYSVVATLAPGSFPASFRHGGEVAVYFEAASVITTLVLLGQVLELRARSQTSSALKALLGLAPKTARRLGEGSLEEDVPLEQVQPGDRLRVPL